MSYTKVDAKKIKIHSNLFPEGFKYIATSLQLDIICNFNVFNINYINVSDFEYF